MIAYRIYQWLPDDYSENHLFYCKDFHKAKEKADEWISKHFPGTDWLDWRERSPDESSRWNPSIRMSVQVEEIEIIE